MSVQQQAPGWITVARDIAALTFPWLLIFKQAGIIFSPPAEVSVPILWLAGAILGVPGVAQILSSTFGGSSTAASPLPPAPGASSSGPSSSEPSGASS